MLLIKYTKQKSTTRLTSSKVFVEFCLGYIFNVTLKIIFNLGLLGALKLLNSICKILNKQCNTNISTALQSLLCNASLII